MRRTCESLFVIAAVFAWVGGSGCNVAAPGGGGGGGTPAATADFDLSGGLETFEVEAGVPTEQTGTGTFDLSITHISCQAEAEVDVGQFCHSAPQDHVARG